ncbi:hypothetical protein [Streptococcus sp. X13SY08]|nr:hypothetical protein [Streptococcus sp. X13SY08]
MSEFTTAVAAAETAKETIGSELGDSAKEQLTAAVDAAHISLGQKVIGQETVDSATATLTTVVKELTVKAAGFATLADYKKTMLDLKDKDLSGDQAITYQALIEDLKKLDFAIDQKLSNEIYTQELSDLVTEMQEKVAQLKALFEAKEMAKEESTVVDSTEEATPVQ